MSLNNTTLLYKPYAIIFQINMEELYGIADSPDQVYLVDNFASLDSLQEHVMNGTCKRLASKCITVFLNVFIDIQTSKELIQMDTDKMMTYGTFTVDDEKLTQSYSHTQS